MRDLELLVSEMERQGKQLHGMLRVGRLNTMSWKEFQEMVTVIERLHYNLTDFNMLHFGLKAIRRSKVKKIVAKAS